MDGTHLIELHLLSHMRADELVAAAHSRLGYSEVCAALAWAERLGLGEPGPPVALYRYLLGEPQRECPIASGLRLEYRLPLWPKLLFTVMSDSSGQTIGVSFALPSEPIQLPPHGLSELRPWELVDQPLVAMLNAQVVDEWYPMKDYSCELLQPNGESFEKLILQFDYGLLQRVHRLSSAEPPHRS